MAIQQFKEEYRWLSNFYKVNVLFEGLLYPSVEHAYQAAKSEDPDWRKYCLNAELSPGKIKRDAKNIELRADWEEIKLQIMNQLLQQKFNKKYFKSKLLKTGKSKLIEGNYWNDTFWGVDLNTNQGENHLGKLIMNIRYNLQNS